MADRDAGATGPEARATRPAARAGDGSPEAHTDWAAMAADLDAFGCATVGPVLAPDVCAALSDLYDDDSRFRSRILMARHGFGRGEYKYFAHPLPEAVAMLRREAYGRLVPLANDWAERLGWERRWPDTLDAFLEICHAAGQRRPTPLLLRYGAGDFNCLHQDLYGEVFFPFQLAVLLSAPGEDFTGGEFVLVEQRPRMQSRAEVVPLLQGQGVVFATSQRPVAGSRGSYRVNLRHGVSRIRSGERMTLGIIFHDAT